MSDLQGVANHDDGFKAWQKLKPEGQGQTVAGIFPTPECCRLKSLDQHACLHPQRVEPWACKILIGRRRQVPRPAQFVQQLVVERYEPEMFPKAVRIIGLRWHQLFLRTEVKSAGVEQPGEHRRPRAVRSCDAHSRLIL